MFAKNMWYPIICLTLQVLQMSAAEGPANLLPAGGELSGSLQDVLKSLPQDEVVQDSAEALPNVVERGPADGSFTNILSDFSRDPFKAMIKMVDQVAGSISRNVPGGEGPLSGSGAPPLDFLKIFEYVQNTIDRLGGRGEECASVLSALDHSAYTFKQMATLMTSLGKWGDLWGKVDMNLINKCFAMPPIFGGGAGAGEAATVDVLPVDVPEDLANA